MAAKAGEPEKSAVGSEHRHLKGRGDKGWLCQLHLAEGWDTNKANSSLFKMGEASKPFSKESSLVGSLVTLPEPCSLYIEQVLWWV